MELDVEGGSGWPLMADMRLVMGGFADLKHLRSRHSPEFMCECVALFSLQLVHNVEFYENLLGMKNIYVTSIGQIRQFVNCLKILGNL